MDVTTTPSIEGKDHQEVLWRRCWRSDPRRERVQGLFAGIRDIVGGRSATYERELQRARDIALQELQQRATELGANAVVGIDLDYEVMGPNNGMLMVSASGTAVLVE